MDLSIVFEEHGLDSEYVSVEAVEKPATPSKLAGVVAAGDETLVPVPVHVPETVKLFESPDATIAL